MTCSECDQPSRKRGYCEKHYKRWQVHGDPSIVLPQNQSQNARKYTLNQEYFDEITTPEQAYWLGFITADGCVIANRNDNNRGHYSLQINLIKSDVNHLKAFLAAIGSNAPIKYRQLNNSSFGGKDQAMIKVSSRIMAESLIRLGVTPHKSLTVKPWNGPADLMSHFWRGLFDGDGSIGYYSRSWSLSICGSVTCVTGFATWAKEICGSRAKERSFKHSPTCWEWTVGGNAKTRLLAEALYTPGDIALERKRILADTLCERG